jgi:hypothetical protein
MPFQDGLLAGTYLRIADATITRKRAFHSNRHHAHLRIAFLTPAGPPRNAQHGEPHLEP